MQEALNPCQKVAAVVDTETREVVAYGKWAVPLGYLATRDGGSIERNGRGGNSNQEGERTTPLKLPVPEGIRMDVWATFREELDAMRERYLDPSRDFCEFGIWIVCS